MSTINWGHLVDQGRAKAIGISWNEEELHAIYELKIPVEFVRAGVLTLEKYQSEQKEVDRIVKEDGKKPNQYMSKAELIKEALSLGIPVVDEATRADLLMLIAEKKKQSNQVTTTELPSVGHAEVATSGVEELKV